MKCPHCNTGIYLEMDETQIWLEDDSNIMVHRTGYVVAYGHCPYCKGLIVLLRRGKVSWSTDEPYSIPQKVEEDYEEILYPKITARPVEPEVPERYKTDFQEAAAVLPISPKASAALSRRILQDVLHEVFKLNHPNLVNEIEEFVKQKDVPSYLADALDAVRNIGNFAAHPIKNTNTGEIVEVESGEAEWLLETLEALFDFAFVQPKKLEERKKALNSKLQALGKPPLKR